jgi:polar amino acid transport system substrate-binding protein
MRFKTLQVIIIFYLFLITAPAGSQTTTEAVQMNAPVKAALLNNFPPFSFLVNEQLSGFTIDYLELLEEKTGIDFEIVQGTWKQNFTAFRQGEVDLITGISFTEERSGYTLFSDPYYLLPTVVYTRINEFQYSSVNDLKGKTVGIETEVYYRSYLEEISEIRIKEIEDTSELMKQLSFGEVDAVVTNINIGNYIRKQYMLENIKLAGRINLKGIEDEDLRIGVRRELPELHSLIQQGMNQITPAEYKQLQDRWVGFTPDRMQESLSPQDQALVKEYRNRYGGIRLSGRTDWYPIDFHDNLKGQQGIAPDIFNHIHQELHIPFQQLNAKNIEESITSLITAQADVIPAIVPTSEYQDTLAFTKPYIRLPMVIATRGSQFFIGDLSDIQNKHIGIMPPSSQYEQLKSSYPNVEFVEVESVKAGLTKVRDNEMFGFIGTVPAIAYAIKQHNFYNLRITGTIKEQLPIAAATLRYDHSLRTLLDHAVMSIDEEKKSEIIDHWVVVQMEENIDRSLLWQVLAGAAILILIVMLWAHKVKRLHSQISEAYELLEQKNRELERLSTVNQLTGLYNRHKTDQELEAEIQRAERYGRPLSVIMFDIDWFKSVNDNYGHPAGDTVLRKIAALLRNRIRSTDIAGRWGGEEFLIICPETEIEGARELAEQIRADIAEFDFSISQSITISAGVATYTVDETIERLIHRVDEYLYAAKHRGKNRVETE